MSALRNTTVALSNPPFINASTAAFATNFERRGHPAVAFGPYNPEIGGRSRMGAVLRGLENTHTLLTRDHAPEELVTIVVPKSFASQAPALFHHQDLVAREDKKPKADDSHMYGDYLAPRVGESDGPKTELPLTERQIDEPRIPTKRPKTTSSTSTTDTTSSTSTTDTTSSTSSTETTSSTTTPTTAAASSDSKTAAKVMPAATTSYALGMVKMAARAAAHSPSTKTVAWNA